MRYYNVHECTFRYSALAAYETVPGPSSKSLVLTVLSATDPLAFLHSPYLRANRWKLAALICLRSPLNKIGFINTMPVPVFDSDAPDDHIAHFRAITLERSGIGVQDFSYQFPGQGYCGDIWAERVIEVLHHKAEDQWTLISALGQAFYLSGTSTAIPDVLGMIAQWYCPNYWAPPGNITAWVLPLYEFLIGDNNN